MTDLRKKYGVRVIVLVEGLPEEAVNSATVSIGDVSGATGQMLCNAIAGYARSLKRMYQPPKLARAAVVSSPRADT